MFETELERLAGTRMQLEVQVNTLESANLNAETMAAMKKASDALKVIHGNLCVQITPYLWNLLLINLTPCYLQTRIPNRPPMFICTSEHRTMDKVDSAMAEMQEQRDLAGEIADAISNPMNAGYELDEVISFHQLFEIYFQLNGKPPFPSRTS